MADIKFRFPPEGEAKYGSGWFELDFEVLALEVDSGILERFEDETGFMVFSELPDLLQRGSYRAMRAAMWLSVLIAGHRVKWSQFKADPNSDPRRVQVDRIEAAEGKQSDPPSEDDPDPSPEPPSGN